MKTNIKTTWWKVKLGEFANINPTVQLQRGKEYSFLDMADVTPLSRTTNWQKRKIFKGSGARFEEGDTLFARITPCLENGKITQAQELKSPAFGSTEFYVLRGIQGVSDSDFIHYLSRTFRIRKLAEGSMVGASGRQRVERVAFENIETEVPESLEIQKRIADILSAFDDKIELNNKISKNLEATAQAIFKEWFVNFRFPGHEKIKMIDSELGEIPEGWGVKMLPEVFDFLEGPGIRNWQYAPEGCRFINIRLIQNNDIDIKSANSISEKEANGKYKHFHLQERDMVVSTSGTLGRLAIVREEHLPLLLNTSVIRFKPKDKQNYGFMYQFLNSAYFQNKVLSMASGSAQPNFGPVHLKQIEVLMPDKSILGTFGSSVNSIYERIIAIKSENQKLAALRDLLLPKLMSGEILV
ncbi:restriction endonuclease subunit S [Candidatus Wolfebacteria bacterium]|nr:restriction endonuclease subunit S [Candidatus Wolfebacteria bacterium]